MNAMDSIITESDPIGAVRQFDSFAPGLDREIRVHLQQIKMAYIVRGGLDGFFNKVKGKSLQQIVTEYAGSADQGARIVKQGDTEGTTYYLFAPPPDRDETMEQ